MGILKSAADALYTLRFLRIITMDWKDTEAYKVGVVDENGKRLLKMFEMSSEQRAEYTMFHRLAFNLKRLIGKTGGASKIASYAAALYLIKENENIDPELMKLLEEKLSTHYNLTESMCIRVIVPGSYYLNEDVSSYKTGDTIAKRGSYVTIYNTTPVDTILGQDIIEALDIKTNQTIFITKEMIQESAPANSIAGGGITLRPMPFRKKKKEDEIPVIEVGSDKYYNIVNRKMFGLLDDVNTKSLILKNIDTNAMTRTNR